MTAAVVVAWAGLFAACAAAVVGLVVAGKWIMRRAEPRDHIDTFIDAHVPEVGDVFAQEEALAIVERRSMVKDIETMLDDALTVVRAWSR